jgi:alpha-1,6-mannosyltransferase
VKICDLTQSYAETGGGVRTYLHAKRDYLRSRTDHDHVLIVPGPDDDRLENGRSTTYRVASPRVPGSTVYRLLLRSDKVLRILEAEQPDVIEVHCAYNLPWTAIWHRRKNDAAVVGFSMTDVGGAYVEPAVRRVLGTRVGRAARAIVDRYTRSLYSRCDATVAISSEMAEELRERGVDNARWIPLGVDLDRFHRRADPGPVRERFGVRPGDLLLLYAGRMDVEKRPDVVLAAFEQLGDVPAVLVLAGDGPLREQLEERAGSNPRVRVLPFIQDRDRLAELMGSADLYVSAMPHETFGLSVVEAQASGLPILGVRSGAMVERVTDGEDGVLVPPDDPAAIAAAIRELAADRPRLRDMGRAARHHVDEHFSWRRTFGDLLALYEGITSGNGK